MIWLNRIIIYIYIRHFLESLYYIHKYYSIGTQINKQETFQVIISNAIFLSEKRKKITEVQVQITIFGVSMSTCDVFIDNIMPLYQLVRNFQVSNVIRSIMLDHQFIFLSLALCTFFCTLHQAEITILCIEIGISITNVYLQSFFGWREK